MKRFKTLIGLLLVVALFVAGFEEVEGLKRKKMELMSLKKSSYVFPIKFEGKPMFFKCVVGFTKFQKKHLLSIPLRRDVDGYAFYNYHGEEIKIDTTLTGGAVYIFVVDTTVFNTDKYLLITDSTFKLQNDAWDGKHVLIVRKKTVDLYMRHYTNDELKKLWRM